MSDASGRPLSASDRAAETTVVPDDLLSQLIGVGQIDILIGVVTLAHADVIGELVRSASACMGTFFPRLRAAILHVDRGSNDDTAGAAAMAWEHGRQQRGAAGLRTSHLIGTILPGISDGDAVRVMLASADLLQARALVVLDTDAEPMSPGDIAALAAPVREGPAVFVAASFPREPATGLLVSQLVRPLTWTTFGRRLSEPLVPTFACSGAFAAHATQHAWHTTPTERLTRYWVVAAALSGAFDSRQCPLGPRRARSARSDEGLPVIFGRIVSSVFASLDARADEWLAVDDVRDVPIVGSPPHVEWTPRDQVAPRWQEAFARDVRDIKEILMRIVSPETWAALQAATADGAEAGVSDDLWASVLVDFLLSFHHRVMRREHIVQALLPLYRARSGAIVEAHGASDPVEAENAGRAFGARLEALRPRLVREWTGRNEVEHG